MNRYFPGFFLAIFLFASQEPALAQLAASRVLQSITPVSDADYYDDGAPGDEKVALGAQLFFDEVLSGNRNIACATCHHPFAATGDGLSLPVGEGGRGVGVTRDTGMGAESIHERVPRNAPPLFNLGAREFSSLFHDGRVESDSGAPGGIASPAGAGLPVGLDSPLAAQAMFPVTSTTEMAGQLGENPVADAAAAGNLAGPGGVWEQLAQRLRDIDGYARQFIAAFDDVQSAGDITFVHAANAIAAFEATAWRADESPFDRYLRGRVGAMSPDQLRGMRLFYAPGKGDCGRCHGGPFQTDHSFRAIAMPQIGPGKGDGVSGHEDFGRERVTGLAGDRYRFRVPSLRNVVLTAPYGHDGAFDDLGQMIRHHLDSVASLYAYDAASAVLPSRPDLDRLDVVAASDPAVLAALAAANELSPRQLSDREIGLLIDFLHALTDPRMLDLRRDVPGSLPGEQVLRE